MYFPRFSAARRNTGDCFCQTLLRGLDGFGEDCHRFSARAPSSAKPILRQPFVRIEGLQKRNPSRELGHDAPPFLLPSDSDVLTFRERHSIVSPVRPGHGSLTDSGYATKSSKSSLTPQLDLQPTAEIILSKANEDFRGKKVRQKGDDISPQVLPDPISEVR